MMLNVNEIFVGVDGEVNRWGQGGLTTFVRLAGCNLRCEYCDTQYAQMLAFGKKMSVEEVLDSVKTPKITLTGGEPLLQMDDAICLIREAFFRDICVSVETNGSIAIPFEKTRFASSLLSWIVDYKLPYRDEMIVSNFSEPGSLDWVKIVINERAEYYVAKSVYHVIRKSNKLVNIAFGFTENVNPSWIVNKLIQHKLWDVVLNCQIHKFLNLK